MEIKIACSFCGGYTIESDSYEDNQSGFINFSQDDDIEIDLCIRCIKKAIEKLLK